MASSRSKNSTNVRFMKWAIEAADRLAPNLAGELALRAFLTPIRSPRPERERALLEVARPLTVSAGGLPLAAWAWGDGPTVLLAHGWGGRGTQFGALVPALVNRGRRVVAWDAPAHGDSPGRRTTLAGMAEVIRELAGRVGPVDAVVAHSFGAAATTIALARGLDVARVAYVAPLFTIGGAVERFTSALALSPAARRDFEHGLATANLAGRDDLEGARLVPRLRNTPLLVAHDRDDREVPYADGVAVAAAWPGARLVTTAGLGHRRILADPEVIELVAGFVAGADAPHGLVLDEAARIDRELRDPERRFA